MLTAEDNDLVTQVGPGTALGGYMREFWMPALRSETVKAGGDPVKVRVLGEDIVVYRGRGGELASVNEACPHRRASLSLAYNDGDRITCLYHGWKFDTNGRCVDVPTEPAAKRAAFAARVKANRHPVAEAGGMVWVYLGDPSDAPPVPDFEFNLLPADHVKVMIGHSPVNWLQCLEGLVDTVHVGQLHQAWLPATTSQLGDVGVESAPSIVVEEAPYGLRCCADRPKPDGDHYVRITEYIAPFWSFIPHGPKEDRVSMGIVPIDDNNTHQFYIWYNPHEPLKDGTDLAGVFELLLRTPDDFNSSIRGKPKWGQDRKALGGNHFTGISNLVHEDMAVQESQGRIMDRTREHLGSSDLFVTRTRRFLMKAARTHQAAGEAPCAPGKMSLRDIRAMAVDIGPDDDWHDVKPS
jgi:phthalate 4,5-dioxygenase oxygenase subunit